MTFFKFPIYLVFICALLGCGRYDKQYTKVLSEDVTVDNRVQCLTLFNIPMLCVFTENKKTRVIVEVEKIVEIIVTKTVEVEKIVEVERIKYVDRIVEVVAEALAGEDQTPMTIADTITNTVYEVVPPQLHSETPPSRQEIIDSVAGVIETNTESAFTIDTPVPVATVVNPMHTADNPPVPQPLNEPTVGGIKTAESDPNDNAHPSPDPEQAAKNREEYKLEDPSQGFIAFSHQVTTGKTIRKQVLTPAGAPKLDENGHKIYEDVPEVLTFSGTIPENAVEILEDGTLISTVDGSVIAENAEVVEGDTEDEAWENLD